MRAERVVRADFMVRRGLGEYVHPFEARDCWWAWAHAARHAAWNFGGAVSHVANLWITADRRRRGRTVTLPVARGLVLAEVRRVLSIRRPGDGFAVRDALHELRRQDPSRIAVPSADVIRLPRRRTRRPV